MLLKAKFHTPNCQIIMSEAGCQKEMGTQSTEIVQSVQQGV